MGANSVGTQCLTAVVSKYFFEIEDFFTDELRRAMTSTCHLHAVLLDRMGWRTRAVYDCAVNTIV